MSKIKMVAIACIILVAITTLILRPDQYFTLTTAKSYLSFILAYRDQYPLISILIYASIYILYTAGSFPGALILSLMSGAIFGFMIGTAIVTISASIGATLAFLLARYLLNDWATSRWGNQLTNIRNNFRVEGAFYLFSLRLIPLFPFFLINILMGMTTIKSSHFFMATFFGIIPASALYVNAGTQLAKLNSLQSILSPVMLGSLLLLAVFPWLTKLLTKYIRQQRNG